MQIEFNRTRRREQPRYIVIHDTGNSAAGADAAAHFSYFNGGNRGSSADIFVDDHGALTINDYHTYYSWHCGDGRGRNGITNANSVGVELCINRDGDAKKAYENLLCRVRALMDELGIDTEHVVRHYDVSAKCCPASWAADSWAQWHRFRQELKGGLTMTQYEELSGRIAALEHPMIYHYIDANMPEWAHSTVQKLVAQGILHGDGDGLGLNDDLLRMLVILDRAGVWDG